MSTTNTDFDASFYPHLEHLLHINARPSDVNRFLQFCFNSHIDKFVCPFAYCDRSYTHSKLFIQHFEADHLGPTVRSVNRQFTSTEEFIQHLKEGVLDQGTQPRPFQTGHTVHWRPVAPNSLNGSPLNQPNAPPIVSVNIPGLWETTTQSPIVQWRKIAPKPRPKLQRQSKIDETVILPNEQQAPAIQSQQRSVIIANPQAKRSRQSQNSNWPLTVIVSPGQSLRFPATILQAPSTEKPTPIARYSPNQLQIDSNPKRTNSTRAAPPRVQPSVIRYQSGYQCHSCKFFTTSQFEINQHCSQEQKPSSFAIAFKCSQCSAVFNEKDALLEHTWQFHHSQAQELFHCPNCQFTCWLIDDLVVHHNQCSGNPDLRF